MDAVAEEEVGVPCGAPATHRVVSRKGEVGAWCRTHSGQVADHLNRTCGRTYRRIWGGRGPCGRCRGLCGRYRGPNGGAPEGTEGKSMDDDASMAERGALDVATAAEDAAEEVALAAQMLAPGNGFARRQRGYAAACRAAAQAFRLAAARWDCVLGGAHRAAQARSAAAAWDDEA